MFMVKLQKARITRNHFELTLQTIYEPIPAAREMRSLIAVAIPSPRG